MVKFAFTCIIVCLIFIQCEASVANEPRCLDNISREIFHNLRQLTYDDGSNHPVLIPSFTWTSGNILTNIAQILLTEALGYQTTIVGPLSYTPQAINLVAGCLDDNDELCSRYDLNAPGVHFTVESWQAAFNRAAQTPVAIQPDLVDVYDYSAYSGLHLWTDTIANGHAAQPPLFLDQYVSYNALSFKPWIYFDSWQRIREVFPLEYTVRCSEMTPGSVYDRLASVYLAATNDTVACSDDDTTWFSPACRFNKSQCIPVLTQYDYQEIMQYSFWFNMPIALVRARIGGPNDDDVYYGAIRKSNFLFFWWTPDDSLGDGNGQLPMKLTFPIADPLQQQQGIFKTGWNNIQLRNYAWHSMSKIDAFLRFFVAKMHFFQSDMDTMMEKSFALRIAGASMEIRARSVACDWVRQNEERWKRWLPMMNCTPGTFSETLISCQTCPVGYYCPGGADGALACPASHYCIQGSSKPQNCPGDRRVPNRLAGIDTSSIDNCTECNTGFVAIYGGGCVSFATLFVEIFVPVAIASILAITCFRVWSKRIIPASRRLIDAKKGTPANQFDLPHELRRKYEAVSLLGTGSYGIVLEVWQSDNVKRSVKRAIKLVHSRGSRFTQVELARLDREAVLLSRLASPFVVLLLEARKSKAEDVYWFVMELLDGEALDEDVARGALMTERQAIKVGMDMCHALKAIHSNGFIHRDVKPGNIVRIIHGQQDVHKSQFTPETNGPDGNQPEGRSNCFFSATTFVTKLLRCFAQDDRCVTTSVSERCDADIISIAVDTDSHIPFPSRAQSSPDIALTDKHPASHYTKAPTSRVDALEGCSGAATFRLIDFGSASKIHGMLMPHEADDAANFMTMAEISFAGTLAYASPERFVDDCPLGVQSDIWSLNAALFHLVSGQLPFKTQDAASAYSSLAVDLDTTPPDVRDAAPENVRSSISSAFAAVLSMGLEKRIEKRFQSVDDMCTALHGCLVQRGEDVYSVFISYRVFSEKYHALLLYDLLNNTVTPAGHRVVVYLDVKRLIKGEDWEAGFSMGLLNSLVVVPLLSAGVIEPLTKLTGRTDDYVDNVAKELMIMDSLVGTDHGKLAAIYPVLVGKPRDHNDPEYPFSGNFFSDGSRDSVRKLMDVVSPPTAEAVATFLSSRGCPTEKMLTVAGTVKEILSLQAAQLWNHTQLHLDEIDEDSVLWQRVIKDPPNPPLDLRQLCALKAQLRALVPNIHEVIDLAHAKHAAK